MRATLLCLLAGTTIGLVAQRLRPADERLVPFGARTPVPAEAAPAPVPAEAAPAPVPAEAAPAPVPVSRSAAPGSGAGSGLALAPAPSSAPRIGCADRLEDVGTPLAAIPTWPENARSVWQIAVSRHACVIAAWEGARLVVSWDDGATFSPMLESTSRLIGVAAADDGTVYATRDDGTLGIIHPDGSTTSRTLAFRGSPMARGEWLVINGGDAGGDVVALSPDDGVTWRVLDQTGGYLLDLRVLDDGAIVGQFDYRGSMCDHFGCAEPTVGYLETHLDGRPWRDATHRHAKALQSFAEPPAAPPNVSQPQRDAHDRLVAVAGASMIIRDTGHGWRVLYTGTR